MLVFLSRVDFGDAVVVAPAFDFTGDDFSFFVEALEAFFFAPVFTVTPIVLSWSKTTYVKTKIYGQLTVGMLWQCDYRWESIENRTKTDKAPDDNFVDKFSK